MRIQAQKKAQHQKRRMQQQGSDDMEDVEMKEQRSRGERGGARIRRRKRRKQGLGEVEMASAEVRTSLLHLGFKQVHFMILVVQVVPIVQLV